MGNQASAGSRKVSTESGTSNSGVINTNPLSNEPSPKRSHHPVNSKQDPDFSPGGNKVDIMMKNSKQMNKLELPRRPRRHSDASKNDSQSPSPPQRQRARTTTSNNASPRVRSRNSQPSSAEAVNSRLIPSIPRTPRLAFKKLQVDFNTALMTLGGRRSRRHSAEQEALCFKITEGEVDNTPMIPRDEIFEALKDFDLDSDSDSFRGRAATISNGHAARLKTLREKQERIGGHSVDRDEAKKARPRRRKIPTVFRYMIPAETIKVNAIDPPKKIEKVYIAGTMTGWASVEMVRTKGDAYYCVIIDCFEGNVFYKFCVDSAWTIDYSMEKAIGKQNILANVICVKKSDSEVLEALACDSFVVKSAKPDGPQAQSDWGQIKPRWENKNKNASNSNSSSNAGRSGTPNIQGPPFLPPQLLKSLLNKEIEENSDPNLLPEPSSHVMLNHLYAQSVKDNVLVMASTTRFRKKYATVVLYKPID